MATYTKLQSGSWRAQVRRGGHSQSRTFATKREAQDWAMMVEQAVTQKIAKGVAALPANLTLQAAIDAYLEQVKTGRVARNTLKAFGREMGGVPLRDLNAATLQRWVDHRLNVDGAQGQTVTHNLASISSLLKWLRFNKHLDVDPDLPRAARQSLSAARVQTSSQERDHYITDAELQRMQLGFDSKRRLKVPMGDLVQFALATAMRLGEICRIEWSDFNDNSRTIIIRDRKDPRRPTGNHQRVPLSTKAVEIMMRQPSAERREGLIFPYRPNSVTQAWILARDIAGLSDIRFHDLRHRAITDLFSKGLTIEQVALISGHKTWSQLRRYTQTQAESLTELLG